MKSVLPVVMLAGFLLSRSVDAPPLFLSVVRAQDNAAAPILLVTVNGTKITTTDLEFLYFVRQIKPAMRDAVKDRFVADLIDHALLRQFLDSRKVQASRTAVEQRIQVMKNLLARDGIDLDQSLNAIGCTPEKFRDEMSAPAAWSSYARLTITDDDIKKYWDTHRVEYDGTEVRAAHIVKRLPKENTAAEKERLLKHLADLAASIRSGAVTFAAAAEKESDSPSGKDGGDLGTFPYHGRMSVEFSRVAFKLKVGEVSEPFETPFGLHILTVNEIIPGDLSLEDARPLIFQTLSREMQNRLITQLRTKAVIQYAK